MQHMSYQLTDKYKNAGDRGPDTGQAILLGASVDVQRSEVGTPAPSHIQVRGNQPRKVQRKEYNFGGKTLIMRWNSQMEIAGVVTAFGFQW